MSGEGTSSFGLVFGKQACESIEDFDYETAQVLGVIGAG